MSVAKRGGLVGLVLILLVAGSLRPLSGQSWLKVGGDLNPLGERNPVAFAKLGRLIEGTTYRFTDVTAFLTIHCTATPAPVSVVLNNGPYLRSEEGQARIDPRLPPGTDAASPGPLHTIRWSASRNYILAFLSLEPSLADPKPVDLREELRGGATLTVSMVTSSGTLYYRFNLDGFEVQENLCPGTSVGSNPIGPPSASKREIREVDHHMGLEA